MLWMLNLYMGSKSGWINKERKFCKGLLNIRISPLVQEARHLQAVFQNERCSDTIHSQFAANGQA